MALPILSLTKIFATLIGTFVSYNGYKRWKETKLLSMEYFYKAMFWHSLDCAAFMVMPLFSFNLYFVQLLWNLNFFSGSIFYAYLLALLLLFLETGKIYLVVKNFLFAITILGLIFSTLFLKPAIIKIYPFPFGNLNGITWQSSLPFISRICPGIWIIVIFLIFIPLITKKAFSLKDSVGEQKGIYLVLGVAGLFIAAIMNWLVGPIIGYSFWREIIHGLLCASGQIFFSLGMLTKGK